MRRERLGYTDAVPQWRTNHRRSLSGNAPGEMLNLSYLVSTCHTWVQIYTHSYKYARFTIIGAIILKEYSFVEYSVIHE